MNQDKIQNVVLGNGEEIFIFFKKGNSEMVYSFKNYIISELNMNYPNENYSYQDRLMPQEPMDIQVNFKISATDKDGNSNVKIISNVKGGLLKEIYKKLLNKFNISDLFKQINRKLNDRGDK